MVPPLSPKARLSSLLSSAALRSNLLNLPPSWVADLAVRGRPPRTPLHSKNSKTMRGTNQEQFQEQDLLALVWLLWPVGLSARFMLSTR